MRIVVCDSVTDVVALLLETLCIQDEK